MRKKTTTHLTLLQPSIDTKIVCFCFIVQTNYPNVFAITKYFQVEKSKPVEQLRKGLFRCLKPEAITKVYMCCMGAFARRGKNKVAPFVNEPAASERIEIRKDRWIRLIHYTPRSSAVHPCRENGVEGNEIEEFSRCTPSPESSTTTCAKSKYDTNPVVIFFIHGVGGCAELWEAQLKYFHRAGYEVIAPDLLGHGGSYAPKDPGHYNFQEICSDTVELFDRYAKKRNILVGHSYG